MITQNGDPAAGVSLTLDGSNQNNGVTNPDGAYKFNNLPCNRSYKITPSLEGFAFTLPTVTITKLTKKTATAAFIAISSEKESKTVVAKTSSRLCNPPPKSPPKVTFSDSLTGTLSPETSWCEAGEMEYFHSYQLSGALGGDIVEFDLQVTPPEQASNLAILVTDPTGNPVEFQPGGGPDESPQRQITLPRAGDYILRISDKAMISSEYRLSMTRKGLTDAGYRQQLERAFDAIRGPGDLNFYDAFNTLLDQSKPLTNEKPVDQRINEAVSILDQLRTIEPGKPEAYTMLSVIQLYHRKDIKSAADLALRSLSVGGEARFRVTFGERVDRDKRIVTNNTHPCWFVIRKNKASCEGLDHIPTEIFNTDQKLIKKTPIDVLYFSFGLSVYGNGIKENKKLREREKRNFDSYELGNYFFVPLSSLSIDIQFPQTEVRVIKALLKQFVEPK
ncbi:MAG: carboxypeptidase regulatory-like domain-containing protein [Chloracidobacterium sp.]|nr:carboxypeptidase regulatory-like domain-containing protein [Chloracidobacterium sp.]